MRLPWVIVVEARAEGGAVHTAKCALKEGRPVLAIEWPAGQVGYGSCSYALCRT